MLPCDCVCAPEFPNATQYGAYGERVAARFLRRHGYKILLRNVRLARGEIDLVCRQGEVLAFVEVKARKDDRFGQPSEAVDAEKQRRIIRAAQAYLRELHQPEITYRFDIVEVFLQSGGVPHCRLIRDAFGLERR